MALFNAPVPIESGGQPLRARRTAGITRVAVGICGIWLVLGQSGDSYRPGAAAGFALIVITSFVQLASPGATLLAAEESLSTLAGVLIIGLGTEQVGGPALLWLVAVASGVLARGGRAHWIGRAVLLLSLAMPVARYGTLEQGYAIFCVATVGLLLTAGSVTRELNLMLRRARLEAAGAETLLFAGDLAARMSAGVPDPAAPTKTGAPSAADRDALAAALDGRGVTIAVQPIVDVRTRTLHAYEALARFERKLGAGSPLAWFELAGREGERVALERVCLGLALELFAERPTGVGLTVNVSAPLLVCADLAALFGEGPAEGAHLAGLIVEITEETLVDGDHEVAVALEWLRARGARVAVDDVGAGYSGLRQITALRPDYIKLDRSLVAAIDEDGDRAALVGALAGYANQVGTLIVAEGVETVAELEVVQALNVQLVQGFYFGRPGEPWPAPSQRPAEPDPEIIVRRVDRRASLAPRS